MKHSDISPYLLFSVKFTAKTLSSFDNVFRNQMKILAILPDYGYSKHVLLKTSLIYNLVEDCEIR